MINATVDGVVYSDITKVEAGGKDISLSAVSSVSDVWDGYHGTFTVDADATGTAGAIVSHIGSASDTDWVEFIDKLRVGPKLLLSVITAKFTPTETGALYRCFNYKVCNDAASSIRWTYPNAGGGGSIVVGTGNADSTFKSVNGRGLYVDFVTSLVDGGYNIKFDYNTSNTPIAKAGEYDIRIYIVGGDS